VLSADCFSSSLPERSETKAANPGKHESNKSLSTLPPCPGVPWKAGAQPGVPSARDFCFARDGVEVPVLERDYCLNYDSMMEKALLACSWVARL